MSQKLKKEISLYGLTMIAVGACIGSGIFVTPSDIALQLGEPKMILLAWIIGGIVALTGALSFAELGALFPEAGGVYVYLKNGYGKLMAFLYGWCILTVITSGAIAALCLAFARYISALFPMNQTGMLIVAVFALISVTLINIAGVKMGELFSSIFTSFKLIGIASLIICGIWLGQFFGQNFSSNEMTGPPDKLSLWGAMAIAMIGVLWSYGGWHHASYLSAETKNPKRTVPIAMILGAFIVTLTYVLTNVAYLHLMPVEEMAVSKAIAADALQKVIPIGGILIAILIAISTIGTVGIYTLSAPRIYFSMGSDKTFFPWLAKVNSKTGVPVNAIILQSGWALVLLLFWGTFENLITYVVFMDWIFMIFAAITVFIFRRRKMIQKAGYKTFLYPITPLIFIGISIWFVIHTSIGRPSQAIAGIILLGIGIPVYFYFLKSNKGEKGK